MIRLIDVQVIDAPLYSYLSLKTLFVQLLVAFGHLSLY